MMRGRELKLCLRAGTNFGSVTIHQATNHRATINRGLMTGRLISGQTIYRADKSSGDYSTAGNSSGKFDVMLAQLNIGLTLSLTINQRIERGNHPQPEHIKIMTHQVHMQISAKLLFKTKQKNTR
jgi:hypothetical protein